MPKTVPKKKGTTARGRKADSKKSARGRPSTLTPPRKKTCTSAMRYLIKNRGCYTNNPYAHYLKNKIDVVLHEGGMPSKDAQPQVSLLLGGKTLSVQWKKSEKLFS
jgi:hypothetical protein